MQVILGKLMFATRSYSFWKNYLKTNATFMKKILDHCALSNSFILMHERAVPYTIFSHILAIISHAHCEM